MFLLNPVVCNAAIINHFLRHLDFARPPSFLPRSACACGLVAGGVVNPGPDLALALSLCSRNSNEHGPVLPFLSLSPAPTLYSGMTNDRSVSITPSLVAVFSGHLPLLPQPSCLARGETRKMKESNLLLFIIEELIEHELCVRSACSFPSGRGRTKGDRARPHYNKLIFGLWGEVTRLCCETLRGGRGPA